MVTAEQVKELREKTGAGMMDCKKALAASDGDLGKAVDFLRQQGVLKAVQKATRIAKEGLVVEAVAPDGAVASVLEVNCETDFVARTDDFKNFVSALVEVVLKEDPKSVEALKGLQLGSRTVSEILGELVARLGENISIRRFERCAVNNGAVPLIERIAVYVHPGNKIAALVHLQGAKGRLNPAIVRDVAMHVAAMHPRYRDRQDVPSEATARERETLKGSADLASKPSAIVDKIVEGRFAKFLSEVCLLDQVFIRDPAGKATVRESLQTIDPSLEVLRFVRYQVGEE